MYSDKKLRELDAKLNALGREGTSDKIKTYDEVFDFRTMKNLTKLISSGIIDHFEFPIATGKEANIFKAKGKDGDLAVKIYRTNTATFRSFTTYIDGDKRFEKEKKSLKNIVKLWARKEFVNLKRLEDAEVRVPKPKKQLENILIMEYIGDKDGPAPLLKDCRNLDFEEMFSKICKIFRRIYKDAELVHADFSEYNILVTEEDVPVVIDVGQAVLRSHPAADEFLLRDVRNIVNFFKKRGVKCDEGELLRILSEG